MKIERKYLVSRLPTDYQSYPFHRTEQVYLCAELVVRVRREDEIYYPTYKPKGLLAREECNLSLTKESYEHLLVGADGNVLMKKWYLFPVPGRKDLIVELDVFEGKFSGLVLAEVEFETEEDAGKFQVPDWSGEDVTFSGEYQDSRLSRL